MNIDDTSALPFPEDVHPLVAIFGLQRELMDRYHPIEVANGANVPEPPWSIDDKEVQWRIKHFFWCTTEELGEAWETDTELVGWRTDQGTPEARHFFEEAADAMHFLVEASIISNMDPEHLVHDVGHLLSMDAPSETRPGAMAYCQVNAFAFIRDMGLAANMLKMKPWKTTHMPTDRARYMQAMTTAWASFLAVWGNVDACWRDVWNLYTRKLQVNKFRQDTKY